MKARNMTLEEFLIKRLKKKATIEKRSLPVSTLKDALTSYLQPFHGTSGKELIDIDIPSLTTEEVEIKLYWR